MSGDKQVTYSTSKFPTNLCQRCRLILQSCLRQQLLWEKLTWKLRRQRNLGQKQNKPKLISLAPLKFRFLLMPWLLCKLFLTATLHIWHMLLHSLHISMIPWEVTWRAVGWLSLCTDKSCCVLGVLGKGVLDSVISFVGVAARKVPVRFYMLEINPVWNG